jgi:CBS domain-containing protein
MDDEVLEEEWSIMYQESEKVKVLDSTTFRKPVKYIKVRKPLVLACGRTAKDALDLMRECKSGCVLIVKGGALVGILTERDLLLRVVDAGKDLAKAKVEDFMTPEPEAFQPDDSVAFALNAMVVGGYRHVPIVNDKNEPLAVVSVKDIVNFIADHFPDDLLNLPPRPIRRTEEREGA